MLTAEQFIEKLDEEGKGRGLCALACGHPERGTILIMNFDPNRLESLRGLLNEGWTVAGIVYGTVSKGRWPRPPMLVTGHRAIVADPMDQDRFAALEQYLGAVDKQLASSLVDGARLLSRPAN